jgi:glycerol-3-phosphate dehydrogenase
MKRDLAQLVNTEFDLLVIGGGIYGACVAWDATLRGLSVALLEKGDFGSATSANSLKIIHGGLRYLQHADFRRMRESIRERTILMDIAPHVVHPLAVLIPTYGHGMSGKEILTLAFKVNDLASYDRNRLLDPSKHIPAGYTVTREECLELVPSVPKRALTGAAIYYDAQVYNSERLPLAFIQSAVDAGAQVANYAEVTGLLSESDRVSGASVTDLNTGDQFEVRARMSVNASGPWFNRVLSWLNSNPDRARVRFAKAINLVTPPLFDTYAVGLLSGRRRRDNDAVVNKGGRFLFCVPWRGRSLIGTEYIPFDGDPDRCQATEEEVAGFLQEVRQTCPAANWEIGDVHFVHSGLVPIVDIHEQTGSVQLTKHYQIHDHRHLGIKGLVSLVGVKYTTARDVAEKVVDLVVQRSNGRSIRSKTAYTPLHGGRIENFESYLEAQVRARPCGLGADTVRRLVYNYGSEYHRVLEYVDPKVRADATLSDELLGLKAEVRHAVHEEMAQKLADVVFRRTELGTAGHPGEGLLRFCAAVMGQEMGWSQRRLHQELGAVNEAFWEAGRPTNHG